jgi:predicted anti-sigma-YlaC factor YlaD
LRDETASMREPEITCRELVELATDYQEGALPGDQVALVEEHLALCDWCRTYLEQLERTVALVGELAEEPPAAVLEAALAAFRARRGAPR